MKIGFVGLGIMGKPMAKNLRKAGYEVIILDKKKPSVTELKEAGATTAPNLVELARKSNVIITMLPNSPEVEKVLLGEGGVIEGAAPGTIVIDMSSINPLASQEINRQLQEKGIELLDAPVSGGEPKAIDGTLAVMVGGSETAYQKCLTIMQAMGASVVRVGESGSGNTTKLANQILVALHTASLSEAITLAQKAGVDPYRVLEAIQGGSAGSAVMKAKGTKILEKDFVPGFRIDLHIKDLNNVLDTGHEVGSPLPLTSMVMEMFQMVKADGFGDDDNCAIVRYYEKMAAPLCGKRVSGSKVK